MTAAHTPFVFLFRKRKQMLVFQWAYRECFRFRESVPTYNTASDDARCHWNPIWSYENRTALCFQRRRFELMEKTKIANRRSATLSQSNVCFPARPFVWPPFVLLLIRLCTGLFFSAYLLLLPQRDKRERFDRPPTCNVGWRNQNLTRELLIKATD